MRNLLTPSVLVTLALVTLALAASPAARAQDATDAFGRWLHPLNGSVVKIYRCGGGGACAMIDDVGDPRRRDVHNPDPVLRKRPVEGVVIMKDARRTAPNRWTADLYNTLDGRTYRGSLSVLDRNHVTLVGCGYGDMSCNAVTLARVR